MPATESFASTFAASSASSEIPAHNKLAGLAELAQTMAQGAAAREVQRELPFDAAARFRESGLGRLRLPVAWGGLGGSLVDVFELVAALGAAESNLAHALRLYFDQTEVLTLSPRSPFNDVQIRRVAEGAIFGGASTELGTARPGEITVQLRRDGAQYRLDGRKYYATGTAFSDYARLNVQDDAGNPVIAIVPVQREGFRVLDDWDGMGQRMTASGGLVFENLLVKADEVSPRVLGSLVGRHTGALRQLHLVAVAAGIVRNIVSDAKHYVIHHGRPALHSPAPSAREDAFIQQVVGELAAHSHAIDALVRENARVLDRQANAIRDDDAHASALVLEGALATARTQLVVSKLALQAAERLFEAGGASATARAHNFDRHWRNLRTIFSHNPLTHKARVLGDYDLNGVTTHLTEGRVF